MGDVADFLDRLWQRHGLWLVPSADGTTLDLFGDGEPTPEDADQVSAMKPRILEFLARKPDSTPKTSVERRSNVGRTPVGPQPTFLQPVDPQGVAEKNVGYVGYVAKIPTNLTPPAADSTASATWVESRESLAF